MISKRVKPWKTILTGFAGMAFTLFVIWLFTKDLDPIQGFDNDSQKVFGSLSGDNRVTPIFPALLTPGMVAATRELYYSILDDKTRTVFQYKPNLNFPIYDRVVKEYSDWQDDGPLANATVVMCKNFAEHIPCEHANVWEKDTYWIWLESEQLCQAKLLMKKKFLERNLCTTIPRRADSYRSKCLDHVSQFRPITDPRRFEERCDETISIGEVKVDTVGSDHMASLEMLVKIDETFPGVLNQNSVQRFKDDFHAITTGEKSGRRWDPITMTIIGESVAARIGMFWNDYINIDMPKIIQSNDEDKNVGEDEDFFPALKLHNLGRSGHSAIAYYVCLIDNPKYRYQKCSEFVSTIPQEVMVTFEMTKPDTVVIHDQHWALDDKPRNDAKQDSMMLPTHFDKMLAFNIMLDHAVKNGIHSMFFLNLSANDHSKITPFDSYWKEMQVLMEVIETLGCTSEDEGSVRLTVIEWARLTCPRVRDTNEWECPQEQHGFEDILPDGVHPYGDSGSWLTRTALSIVIEELAQHELPVGARTYSSWDEAIENPMSKQLLELAPPDGDPVLKDLVTSYYVCSRMDLEELEAEFKNREFPTYTNYRASKYLVPFS